LSSSDRREIDFDKEAQTEEGRLRAKLAELTKEIEVLREGPFGPNSPWLKALPDEERAQVEEVMRRYHEDHPEDREEDERLRQEEKLVDTELDRMLVDEWGGMDREERDLWDPTKKIEEPPPPPKEPFEVELTVPETQQSYVNRFNKTLKALQGNPTPAQKQDAWRSYRRCKDALPFFLEIVPREALDMLWNTLVPPSESQGAQRSNLEMLAKDVLSSGHDLRWEQWMDYLDALHHKGRHSEALVHWEGCKEFAKERDTADLNRYWHLGMKILVANDKLDRAQRVALSFLAGDETHDSRILIPIVVAWAQVPGPKGESQAWTLYLKLRTMLGDRINMGDYDALSVGFLKAGKAALALAVFKDMMLTGKNSMSDSRTLFKAAIGLVGSLHESSIAESDVNKVSLGALTILPRTFQNKFFYGSWLKKLIGMGEVDSAAQVVELMYERGVKPDPRHLNGIMGAWLREGSRSSRDKAERLGWAMIQERIDQVWKAEDTDKPDVHDDKTGAGVPHFMQRRVPPASIETFSILLLHYTRRDQDQLVQYLIQSLQNAKLNPNTFFMNHLLYRELRRQNIFGVWSGYQELVSTVKPDLETFSCLWDTGKLQYDRTRYQYDNRFPTARRLYEEMMTWYQKLSPFHQKATRDVFSKELYEQIVRCFCLSLDLHGTLVTLRSLKEIFGFFPDTDVVRILLFLIVRIAPLPPGAPKSRRRRISSTPRARENLEYATQLVDGLRSRKEIKLSEEIEDPDQLDEASKQQFEVDLMSDVLRVVLLRLSGDPETVERDLRDAAEEMGVSNVNLGKPPDFGG
jgi:pentatricopeptide repeat protein